MNLTDLDTLVRTINPATFSEAAHGSGFRIVREDREHFVIHKSGLLKRLLGPRETVQYFVKKTQIPLIVKTWRFHWSEGASAITLDFASIFELQVQGEVSACSFVKALDGEQGPSNALHELIGRELNNVLRGQLDECGSEKNLLARFRTSTIGIGESETVNRQVSQAVSGALGTHFRIGFTLESSPPMQVEVKGDDEFTLADSAIQRKVVTIALLELDNYQTFKKTGLETDEAIQKTIVQSISQAVKRHLFAQKHQNIMKSFASENDSIKSKMEADIEADARRIGYRVRMFQSFPDIAALVLLETTRIDIPAEDSKYRPRNSTGYVQMELSLSVKAVRFELLHRLISPDENNISQPIIRCVQQICKDQIQKIGRTEFNLRFDEMIVPQLSAAITEGLQSYGLDAEVINIIQTPTEEAARYQALRSERPIAFSASIATHADGGHADPIAVEGNIQITDILENGWDAFESKDFGFRRDSNWTDTRMRSHAEKLKIDCSNTGPLDVLERRSLAIAFELDEIRERVEKTLEGELSKIPGLAREWSSIKTNERIADWIQERARAAIGSEFGLAVSLRTVRRSSTAAENTILARRTAEYDLLLDSAAIDKEHELEKRRTANEATLNLIRDAHERDHKVFDDDDPVVPKRIEDALAREREAQENAQRVTLDRAHKLLDQPPAVEERKTPLPWDTKRLPDESGGNETNSG
ncbi:hypothetical protein [Paraburkholderia terrae]